MERVKSWLANPDYSSGVEIYIQHGKNDFLKQVFQQGESDYTRKKLFEELSALQNPSGSSSGATASNFTTGTFPDNSFLLKKLRSERQQVYRQIDANMYALSKARTVLARRQTAFQILRLQKKKQQLLDEIDHLEMHGFLPVKPTKAEFTTPEIQRVYVQIWKTKKRLEGTDLRDRKRTEQLLKDKLQLLEELRKERGNV